VSTRRTTLKTIPRLAVAVFVLLAVYGLIGGCSTATRLKMADGSKLKGEVVAHDGDAHTITLQDSASQSHVVSIDEVEAVAYDSEDTRNVQILGFAIAAGLALGGVLAASGDSTSSTGDRLVQGAGGLLVGVMGTTAITFGVLALHSSSVFSRSVEHVDGARGTLEPTAELPSPTPFAGVTVRW